MSHKPLNLLIADDKKVFRSVFRQTLLEDRRIATIKEAESVEEMVDFVNSPDTNPDIIFIDEYLSGMSGYEAAHRLLVIKKDLNIVILTVNNTLRSRALAKEAGAVASITKMNLVDEIDNVLDARYKDI